MSGNIYESPAELVSDPRVRALLEDVARWPGTVLNSHRSSSQTFHALEFLSELGFPGDTPEIAHAVECILSSMGEDGIPRLPMTYPAHFGGPGVETACWALCDAPTLLLCAVRFGKAADSRVVAGVRRLVGLCRPNGWPCAVSPELGSFRGPGKKDDPCPYATLIMLRLLAEAEDAALAAGPQAAAGVEALLDCWDRSRDYHPYLFYMGTDFRKLKAPFIWYDLLHVLDVLSRFPAARVDPRFAAMLVELRAKRRPDGAYVPESIYQPYKAWDFGQKKQPSSWIRRVIDRIERRVSD